MDSSASPEKSSILILTICSYGKLTSGEKLKGESTGGITSILPKEVIQDLKGARYKVRNLITGDTVSRNGILLRDMPFNADLVDGPEFNGKNLGGKYKPAIQRYHGRFYKSLGNEKERADLAFSSSHHLLIISGLYGILTPSEFIQCYSCHVPEHSDIAKAWTENDLLTQVLLAYIKRFNIKRIFDFMAEDSYRNLVSWADLRSATKDNVLHAYSDQFAGPDLLPSLGSLAEEFLAIYTEDDLFNIMPNKTIELYNDKITFLPFPMPNPPIAREIPQQQAIIEINDKISRIRRNYINIIRGALKIEPEKYFGSFSANVTNLKKIIRPDEYYITGIMYDFDKIRRDVEYYNYDASELWETLSSDYFILLNWAKNRKYTEDITFEIV